MMDGKRIMDRILRKMAWLSKDDIETFLGDHITLNEIDALLGKDWDVNIDGQIIRETNVDS